MHSTAAADWTARFSKFWSTSLAWMSANALVPAIVILLVLALATILNRLAGRLVKDIRYRYYVRKVISFTAGSLIVLTLFLALVGDSQSIGTILGFATAGVAIALQDVIVSAFGWFFLISRRGVAVGDRIQIEDVKGDVVDITLFRLTMLEIGNWVLGEQSTGRTVVFPNSFVFKKHFYNYTSGHQYVWEEIHIEITFESNWKKAKRGLQEILDQETRELLEAARSGIARAGDRIFLRTGVLTPIVWTSIASSGVRLALRYLTQARTRRALNSRICERILDFVNAAADVNLAYDTRRQLQEVVQPSPDYSLEVKDQTREEKDG